MKFGEEKEFHTKLEKMRSRGSNDNDEEAKVLLSRPISVARHSSGDISAPNAHGKRKRFVGRPQGSSSSSKNVDKTGSGGESTPRRRGRPNKSSGMSNIFGNKNEDIESEEIEIEKIDEAAFRNQKAHSLSKIGPLTLQEPKKNHSTINSEKNVNTTIGESTLHRGRGSPKKRRSPLESTPRVFGPRNHNEDMEYKEIEIEQIDEAEFRNQKTLSLSKIRLSAGQERTKIHSTTISRKNVNNSRKVTSSVDLNQSFSKHGWPNKSSSFVQKGRNNKDFDVEGIMIDMIDKAEFNNKSRSMLKIGLSKMQELDEGHRSATFGKNVDCFRKKIFSANLCRSFSSKDADVGSEQGRLDKSSSFVQKGNSYGDMEVKDYEIESIDGTDSEIEMIDEKEFRNEKMHFKSLIGPSSKQEINEVQSESDDGTDIEVEIIDESQFKNKKMLSRSQIGPSSKQEFNEGQSGAVPGKNVDSRRKKISSVNLYASFFHVDANDNDFCQGDDNESMSSDSEETMIERIDEAEFRQKSRPVSKSVSIKRQKLDEGYFAATFRKTDDSLSKKIPFVDLSGSFSSEDAGVGSNQGQPDKSSSSMQRDNNLRMNHDEIGIEFTSKNMHSRSKVGSSKGQELDQGSSAATIRKNEISMTKKIIYADFSGSCPPDHACRDSDEGCQDKSNSFGKKGNNNEYTCSKEIKIQPIDEAEFKCERTHVASKKGPLTGQGVGEGYCKGDSCENASIVKEVTNHTRSLSSEDAGSDSGMGQTDQSRSLAEEGNNEEDMDFDMISVEKTDEAEFRNNRTNFVSKIESSFKSELNGEYFAATSGGNLNSVTKKVFSTEKFDGNRKKKGVSTCTRKKKNEKHWNRNVSDDANTSSINAYQRGNEIRSNGVRRKIDLSIASRTRSRAGITKQASKVDYCLLDSSDDSDSSSTDDSDDFGVERLYNSDNKESLGSYVEKHGGQNNKSMEVSAEESEDCSKNGSSNQTKGNKLSNSDNKEALGSYVEKYDGQNNQLMEVSSKEIGDCSEHEGILVNRTTKERSFSNHQDEEKDCNQPTLPRQKFSLRNKQFSNNCSSKQTKGQKTWEMNEVREQNGEINKILDNDDNSEECFKEKSDGKNKKFYCGDDDIQKPFDSTSSDSHVNCETEKITVPDEIEKPTKRKQVASNHYDFCQMLADSVLEKGPTLATKESDEQAKQAPVSQAKNTLPLKFRFEDEVPKVVEKTEFQKEMDGLFTELDFCCAMDELGSVNYPEVVQENQTDPAEETQRDRCTRGNHELELKDDEGIICIYCGHVELGPKDVMPPWVENRHRESKKKKHSEKEQPLEFGEFHLQSSTGNIADFRNCPKGTVWNIKPGVKESMYEHQQEGFEFLWKNLAGSINLNELNSTDPGGVGGCIISHAPGTGKTRLTIVFIETYLRFFPNCRPVIIAPASMLLTWEEEFRKWNVDFPFYNINSLEFTGKENKTALRVLVGSKRENKDTIRMVKIYSWNAGGSILGISYSLFEKLTGEKYTRDETGEKRESVNIDDKMKSMRKILLEKPGLVILDEGHTPRNKRSNIWNALLKLHTQRRVVLSGTPFQNNFEELFNMFRIVRPAIAQVLVQERAFAEMITSRKKYKARNQQSTSAPEITDHSVEKLKISMSPFVHVHKGTILQQSLPGLKDCVVLMRPSPLQKSLIERLEGSPSTFQFEHQVALISVHPYLFKYCDSTEEQRTGIDLNAVKASKLNPTLGAKTKFIIELVHLSVALKEKVLIFSQYIQPLRLLNEQLNEIFKWGGGKHILQMEGKLDQNQRQSLINRFNDPLHESKVMLASTRCCSEGISLVGASRVVLLDVVWNPSVERQAICRAYRIGQKKFVYTYHLMTSGTTEADKYCRQAEKERLSDLVFTSSSNEGSKEKHPSGGIEDMILEKMVDNDKLKDMFEKIINQPKDADLIQSFGLTAS